MDFKDTQEVTEFIHWLFDEIQAILPAFKQAWPSEQEFEQAKREWVKALNQVGLTEIEAIKRGVARFRVLPTPFVPSPGQFIEMCLQNDDLGLPSIHEAWQEVKKQISESEKKWSHVCIQHSYKQTGSWDLKHLSEKDALALFTRNYEISCRMFREGKEFEPILPALPKQHYASKQTEEARKAAMEKMRNSLK